jgi:hypothetical protein
MFGFDKYGESKPRRWGKNLFDILEKESCYIPGGMSLNDFNSLDYPSRPWRRSISG